MGAFYGVLFLRAAGGPFLISGENRSVLKFRRELGDYFPDVEQVYPDNQV